VAPRSADELEMLAKHEHERWMAERVLTGKYRLA
jgi:hypothetical protein